MAETKREMALRHVRRGREIIALQETIIAHLRAMQWPTDEAEALLERFRASQEIFESDLAAIEAKAPKS